MGNIFDFLINRPMGIVLKFFYDLFGHRFGMSIFVFTLIINLLLLPLSIKGQTSQMKSARIKPKLDALKEKFGDDRRGLQEAQMQLQQREGISMTGGCLMMFIRLPFLWGIYNVVTNPLTNLLGYTKDTVAKFAEVLAPTLKGTVKPDAVRQLQIINDMYSGDVLKASFPAEVAKIIDPNTGINFDWFGLKLYEQPVFHINIVNNFQMIWLIPILSFATAMLSSIINLQMQKRMNPDAPRMGGMMLMMPVISLIIGFTVPGAVGFYWACSNIIGCAIQVFVQFFYNPNKLIAKAEAKDIALRRKKEREKINAAANSVAAD